MGDPWGRASSRPSGISAAGRRRLPERLFFEAVLYLGRTGIPWRDLPGEFGAWDAVCGPVPCMGRQGSLARLFLLLTDAPAFGEVKACCRCVQRPARRALTAGADGTAAEQGLGRSRGGFTSKVVLTAADEDTAIAVDVVPGQTHEASHLEPMLDATAARVPDMEEVVADKGFDGDRQRQACRGRPKPVILFQGQSDSPGRLNKKAVSAQRNRIERLLGKLKEFRRVATRYEKLEADVSQG